ncbi:MAG TPA: ABC transporter permease subunit, partial [Phycisphaerales bacterium]|nr:ABC transporter permease subunit [Phycisphaerales bacterium]
IYLAVLIVVQIIMLLESRGNLTYQRLALNGAETFQAVAYLQLGLICILSPVFMAGAIAQESNPKTWEVMLTTPLSAAQMVLGHLFGRLFFVLVLLFASLPLFAITQYYGGVRGDSILSSYAVSACAALLVGSIAVAIAVNRIAGRRAVFTFYVSVISYLAVTWVIDAQLQSVYGRGVTAMTGLNPFLALRALLNPTGYPTPSPIELESVSALQAMWMGSPVISWCVLSAGLSVLLIGVSTFGVRAVASAEGAIPWHRRLFGLGARGASARPPRAVWNNPIAWREAAARQATLPRIIARWAFLGIGLLWGLGIVLYYHGGAISTPSFRYVLMATVFTEILVITLVAVNLSATAISREREDGTLDLLLTTPITQSDYLNGKLRGLISYLVPLLAAPLGTVLFASVYVMADGFGREGGVMSNDVVPGTSATIATPAILPEAVFTVTLAAIPFLAFCIMIGLQWSLRSKGTIASVVATVGVIGLIAGVVGLCGWKSAEELPVIGPLIGGLNPLVALLASVEPATTMAKSVGSSATLTPARVSLAIGSGVAVVVYAVAIYAIRANMLRTFDITVRRLAGAG